MIRSYLFVPGSDEKKIAKAILSGSDAIIFDLEDSVANSEKKEGRYKVAEALLKNRISKGYVRINSLNSPFYLYDLEQIVGEHLDGIVLPKTDKGADIIAIDAVLTYLEATRGLTQGQIELIPLVESAKGVWRIEEILTQCKRVKKAAFGPGDFILDIGAQWTKGGEEFLYARSRIVVASRAVGAQGPIDVIYQDVHDMEGFTRDAMLGRQLGYKGKLVIHPEQVAIANKVFSPSEEEIALANKIVNAFEEAEKKGLAAIKIDNKLIDYPMVEMARRILANSTVE